MVTEPDLRSPEEAREFLVAVRAIARALGVSEASPEEGKMRADVNVSLREPGGPFGTKVEVKNLNSFKSVQAALAFEIHRQTVALEEGFEVVQETRGWNEGGQKTYALRTKEQASDYRYFPDPDLPVMHIPAAWQEEIRGRTPELPEAKAARYRAAAIRDADAEQIAYDVAFAQFFDTALEAYEGHPQTLANWLVSEVPGELNARERSLASSSLTPGGLARLVHLVDAGTISGKVAKDLLPDVMDGADPEALVAERGLQQITDEGAIEALVDDVMATHPDMVVSARENPKAINALLGRVMQASRGKANPETVRSLLEAKLAGAD
jgi:aspartyl-tRNA(Asn)/glutamyl-tRNA(Gln) amidotransferase subunit B